MRSVVAYVQLFSVIISIFCSESIRFSTWRHPVRIQQGIECVSLDISVYRWLFVNFLDVFSICFPLFCENIRQKSGAFRTLSTVIM